jgi:hypothetical protein
MSNPIELEVPGSLELSDLGLSRNFEVGKFLLSP